VPGKKVTLKAGLHCGPVVAGVVGDKLPRFRLFGNTVNTTARLQDKAPEGSTLLSAEAAELLSSEIRARDSMQLHEYGSISMKGLNEVDTFVLEAERDNATLLENADDEAEIEMMSRPKSKSWSCSNEASREWLSTLVARGGVLYHLDTGLSLGTQRRRHGSAPCLSSGREDFFATISAPSDTLCQSSQQLSRRSRMPSCRSQTSTGFPTTRRSVTSLSSFTKSFFSNDSDDDELLCTPVHTRVKTPTARLSPSAQLGWCAGFEESSSSSSSDDDAQDGVPCDRVCTSDDSDDDGTQLNGSLEAKLACKTPASLAFSGKRRPSSATASALLVAACEPDNNGSHEWYRPRRNSGSQRAPAKDDVEFLSKNTDDDLVRQEVVRRLEQALEEDQGLFIGLAHFFSGEGRQVCRTQERITSRESIFRELQARRSLGAHQWYNSSYTIAGAFLTLLLMLPAVALIERPFTFQLSVLAAGCTILFSRKLMQIEWQSAEVVSIISGHIQLVCAAVSIWACGHVGMFNFLPWLWFAIALLQRPPLVTLLPISVIGILVSATVNSTHGISALLALLVLQWADDRVERRRHMVQRIESTTQEKLQVAAENLMPPSVICELRSMSFGGEKGLRMASNPVCHTYKLLTILQADLVGFTAFARSKKPEEVVCVVNGLFSIFDECVGKRAVYKMETVGDAYICVSGLPDYNHGQHSAASMLFLASEFIEAIARYKELCSLPETLGLRVGVHSGSCVGGVLGTTMKRYHLFGRTMRIVEKLESTCTTNRVHFSATTKAEAEHEQEGRCTFHAIAVCSEEGLFTSKGEHVPPEDIGNLPTYLLDDEPAVVSPVSTTATPTAAESTSIRHVRFESPPVAAADPELPRLLAQLDLAVSWHSAVTDGGMSQDLSPAEVRKRRMKSLGCCENIA